jgi:hypothetical protein
LAPEPGVPAAAGEAGTGNLRGTAAVAAARIDRTKGSVGNGTSNSNPIVTADGAMGLWACCQPHPPEPQTWRAATLPWYWASGCVYRKKMIF